MTGWWFEPTPLKNDGLRQLGWKSIPNWMESHKIHVPNHQPENGWKWWFKMVEYGLHSYTARKYLREHRVHSWQLVGDFNPSHNILTVDKYVQLGFNISSRYPVVICNSYVPKAMENNENMLRLQWKIMENLHFDLEYMGVVVNPTKHHNIWWDLDYSLR